MIESEAERLVGLANIEPKLSGLNPESLMIIAHEVNEFSESDIAAV